MTDGIEKDRLTGAALRVASLAPRSAAYLSPRTFSAYEVDFTPVSAPRSFRVHGAVTIEVSGGAGAAGASATIKVGGPYAASDPNGPRPPV
jgi:hypothetical protein